MTTGELFILFVPLFTLVTLSLLSKIVTSLCTIQTGKKILLSGKGLGTSLALECLYAGFVSRDFPCKIA